MNEKMLIPGSILIAGLLIAGGLYLSGNNNSGDNNLVDNNSGQEEPEFNPPKIDKENDHILGNKNAEVFVVEYSDLECPFCKRYNDTVFTKLKEKYGDNDKIAFVFRQFPLTSLHPSAFGESVATECAAELGGEEKFFEYKDKVFSETKSDGKFPTSRLPEIATEIGLDRASFEACLDNDAMSQKVKDSYDAGLEAGVRGTPTIYIENNGQSYLAPADFDVLDQALSSYVANPNQN